MTVNRYENFNGGDDRKILSYALFYGYRYGQSLGVGSLTASADTKEELKDLPEIKQCEAFNEWQIVETSTFRVTDAGDDEGDTIRNGVEL